MAARGAARTEQGEQQFHHVRPTRRTRHRGRQAPSHDLVGLTAAQAQRTPDDLDDRVEGDALAVGHAPPAEHVGPVADPADEVGDQAGLADPGSAEHGDEVAAAAGDRAFESVLEGTGLALAADHRRVEAAGAAVLAGADREQAVRRDRLGLALGGDRLDGLDLDGVADQVPGLGTEQDLAGTCRLLEAGGGVDRVAGRERAARARRTGDHGAGVDAGADREGHAVRRHQLGGQVADGFVELGRSAHRAQGVVLPDVRVRRRPRAPRRRRTSRPCRRAAPRPRGRRRSSGPSRRGRPPGRAPRPSRSSRSRR